MARDLIFGTTTATGLYGHLKVEMRQFYVVRSDCHHCSEASLLVFHPFGRSCRYLGAVAGNTGIAFREEQKVCELFTLTNWPCLL